MRYRFPARRTTRRTVRTRVAGLVVVAAIAVALGGPWLASSFATAASPIGTAPGERLQTADGVGVRSASTVAPVPELPHAEHSGSLGEADGAVPDGTTVFDDDIPGVAKLDPALLGALRRAATDAAAEGVHFVVTSGWRSPAYEQRLLDEAISKYGSEKEAARWVATPNTSAHVSGHAVDLGPRAATAWLSARGAQYGLCQIYRNEPWHFELRPEAVDHGCPPVYADPTHDPRMRP